MAKVNYKEMIGVCGLMGSGKTQVSSLIASERDYHYVNADELFKKKVVPDPVYVKKLGEFLQIFEIEPLTEDGKYNSKGISNILFNDAQSKHGFPVLRAFNRLNSPFIEDALRDATFGGRDCIVEMATLPAFSDGYSSRFDAVIIVMGDTWENDGNNARNHIDRIMKRDGRDPEKILKILKYQMNVLKPHLKSGVLFQLENMDTDFPEEEDCSFPEVYRKPEDILAQFDEIVKSARALKYSRIKHGVF